MKKLTLITLLLGSFNASAAVIDFESTSFSSVGSYTESGVTFTAGTYSLSTAAGPVGGTVVRSDPFTSTDPFKAELATTVSSVSVDLGDFAADSDDIFLSVYDSANNLLGTTSTTCCTTDEMVTLSLSYSGISYALFGSIGTFQNSVFFDNFSYVSQVPLPAPALLLAPAVLGFMGLRRKANNT
jgi:hypothetical protein